MGVRICSHCRKALTLADRIGRRETCPFCGTDLHICLNCRFYETGAYNTCREPQAERVLDKYKSNFCDYFNYADGSTAPPSTGKMAAKDRLDTLFSK